MARRRSYRSGWYGDSPRFREYVPVAARRARAARTAKQMSRDGRMLDPVVIEGRTVARTFWGSAWCTNLESYSDFSNRLPRGRTYVRNGSVIDLVVSTGQIAALVQGSDLYEVKVAIAPANRPNWNRIVRECAGGIGSVVELLQGRLSDAVMQVMVRRGDGLFPTPPEISMSCTCPDWATMCKHVAAVLYGVGARLDRSPELLFVLRNVDPSELIAKAATGAVTRTAVDTGERHLRQDDLGAVFGIDVEEAETETIPPRKPTARSGAEPKRKPKATQRKTATKKTSVSRARSVVAKPARRRSPAAKRLG